MLLCCLFLCLSLAAGNYIRVRQALFSYRSAHPSVSLSTIPMDFVVPVSDEYPAEVHNLPLGSVVHAILTKNRYKKHTKELRQEFNLIPSVPNTVNKNSNFESFLLALETYQSLYNDVNIPSSFVVPTHTEWPSLLWNMALGRKVVNVRHGIVYKDEEKIKMIKRKGFQSIFRKRQKASKDMKSIHGANNKENSPRSKWDKVYTALKSYQKIYPDKLIREMPYRFVVPDTMQSPFPSFTHGLRLGEAVSRIVNRGDYKKHADVLNREFSLCYMPISKKQADFDMLVLALQSYKDIYKNLEVPANYSIPDNDDRWPSELKQGYQLGPRLQNIRTRGYYKDRHHLLDEMGLGQVLHPRRKRYSADQLLMALRIYKEKVDPSMRIRCSYIVPCNEDWPVMCHNLPLGAIAAGIRNNAKHKDLYQELLELGFDFIR